MGDERINRALQSRELAVKMSAHAIDYSGGVIVAALAQLIAVMLLSLPAENRDQARASTIQLIDDLLADMIKNGKT